MAMETAAIRTVTISNPATGEVLGQLDCASPAEVKAAVNRVRAAQPAWQRQFTSG
jgi:acyl-CoA reductase-like NAD-dependent aldehyde dehydrogenase